MLVNAPRTRERAGGRVLAAVFGLDLIAHRPDMFGLGPDPDDVVAFDDFGELGILAQEAVAWMDRVGVRSLQRK